MPFGSDISVPGSGCGWPPGCHSTSRPVIPAGTPGVSLKVWSRILVVTNPPSASRATLLWYPSCCRRTQPFQVSDRHRATQVEIVDFDRLARAVARGVQAEMPRATSQPDSSHATSKACRFSGPGQSGIGACVVLQCEGWGVNELGLGPRLGVDQVEVPWCAVTRCEQKTREAHNENVFRNARGHRCKSVPARCDNRAKARLPAGPARWRQVVRRSRSEPRRRV